MSRLSLRRWGILFLLTAVLILTISCNSTPPEAADTTPPLPIVTLIENPWPTSQLNAAVAATLIKNEIGYQATIVQLEEAEQWEAIALGQADASLEIWPVNNTDQIAQYIQTDGRVINGGPLGPQPTSGWYLPTYIVNQHPELASWQGFQNPELTQLFATANTTENAGQFLAGDPSWVQYDADIITNLGLNLEVVTAGSEEALLTAVDTAYTQRQPILFHFYEPHPLFTQYDLTKVELPEYNEECYADPRGGTVNCAYPTDNLFKIFNPELESTDPAVYTLLSNLQFTTADHTTMLASLEEGLTIKEAAQNWIDNNPAVWQSWLP